MLMLISEFSKDAPVMTIYLQSLTGRWKWERWITNTDCMSLDKTWANLLFSYLANPTKTWRCSQTFMFPGLPAISLSGLQPNTTWRFLSSQPKPNPQLDTFLSGDRFWAGLLGGGKELKWKTTVSNPNSGGGVPWAVLPALSPPWAGRPQVLYLISFYYTFIILLSLTHVGEWEAIKEINQKQIFQIWLDIA